MKFTISLFFYTLAAITCMAQQNVGPADSLKKVLLKAGEDTTRVWVLLRLVNATFTTDPDEAMRFADEALALSEKIKWKKGVALSYKVKGGVDYVRARYVSSLDNGQKALANDPGESPIFKVGVLNNIANVYRQLKQYDKIIPVYLTNLQIAKDANNKEEQAMALHGIGIALHLLKRYDSAAYCMKQSLMISEEVGNKRMASSALSGLSVVCRETGRYIESGEYAEKSIRYAKESGNNYVSSPALNNLASAHFHMGNYEKALIYNKESMDMAKEMQSMQWEYEAWETMSAIYEKQNKPGPALDAYKRFILLRDSVMNDEKKQEITRKEIQFEADKKEAVLKAEYSSALKHQRVIKNTIIVGALGVLVTGILLFLFYKKKNDAQVLQKEAELKADIADTEMKALRAQMNPHFIFNSLNSISDYINKNNTKAADEYLTKFAKVMRMTLKNSEKKTITLADDLKNLELYMQLEAQRLNNKFSYQIKVADDIDQDNTLVPPMIFQPFVENSIWHGMAKKEEGGVITIDIRKEGEMIHCMIDDNGIGRQFQDAIAGEMKTSLGMKITKSRIDILNKLKGTDAGVQLIDKPQGVRAEVKLPLELNF